MTNQPPPSAETGHLDGPSVTPEQIAAFDDDGHRHYYGLCETDNVLVQIEVGPEAPRAATLPDREDWEDSGLRCPVCGNTVPGGYDGADDHTTDDERTARVIAERRLRNLRAMLAEDIVDHPMWEGVEYSAEREARIADFVAEVAERVTGVAP